MHTKASAPSAPARQAGAGSEAGRYTRASSEEFGIVIDAAVGYSLRLIPSNKILGRFASTREAWPVVIAAVEAGRSPRMLVLDWHGADGSRGAVSSGATLEYLARSGLGLPAEHLRSPDQRRPRI
ncbi:MAG: hypothetical protein ABSG37_07870 [Candidatus Limnocylindrales bacterium]|jgi:hypothetical protein